MPNEAAQNVQESQEAGKEANGAQGQSAGAEPDPAGAEALGDPGKKALDAMKAKWKSAEDANKQLQQEFAALKAQVSGKEAEHQAAIEAQKVRDDALKTANERILKAEVRAAAAGKLTDPQDAFKFLDLSEFEVDTDGNVTADLAGAIEDLIKSKPYLAAQGKRFEGGADQGARKESRPAQLSRQDIQRLFAEKKYDEIAKAQADGRIDDLIK